MTVCIVGTLPDMSHVTWYRVQVVLHRGKLKEAATGSTNPMTTMAPVILVVSYGTTRLLSNSPAHSHSRSLTPDQLWYKPAVPWLLNAMGSTTIMLANISRYIQQNASGMLPALCGKFTTGGRYNSIISRNDAGYVTDMLWPIPNISRNDSFPGITLVSNLQVWTFLAREQSVLNARRKVLLGRIYVYTYSSVVLFLI